jgi:hypothetical protein
MRPVAPESQAAESLGYQGNSYPMWPEIEKALECEPDLRSESTFNNRVKRSRELNARHRQVLRNSAWTLSVTWGVFIAICWIGRVPHGSASQLGYLATLLTVSTIFVVTVKEGSRIAKRWFPQISITVR